MRIAERPTSRTIGSMRYDPFFNNIYMTIVTITTVGYGDFSPASYFGKLIAIITAFWGGFIISLLIVSVEGIFSLSNKETKAFSNLGKTSS
jgi:voltage-gated potassium channel Kch